MSTIWLVITSWVVFNAAWVGLRMWHTRTITHHDEFCSCALCSITEETATSCS